MALTRASGIILPVSSLPGPYGIGSFGVEARRFVDFLQRSGQRYWQILPLTPTGFGDSPYQSGSVLAGNPYFIDLSALCEAGYLLPEEADADFGDNPDAVDYGKLFENRFSVLRRAYERACGPLAAKLAAFARKNADWLPDTALFFALKRKFDMVALSEWPDPEIRARKPAALKAYAAMLKEEVQFEIFLQYIFFTQWMALKAYANERGVMILGDLPIYVSADSVEMWADSRSFQVDSDGAPRVVAGVPPDYYAENGQFWGNPIYDWTYLEKTGFQSWMRRLTLLRERYDVIRIDHFRAFYNYWSVPADAETAKEGHWRPGPRMKFIRALRSAHPDLQLVAEDLGDLDERVVSFFKQVGFPGMDVLIYSFDPYGDNPYLPHNAGRNRFFYTSTHDAPTFIGWLTEEASPEARQMAYDYLNLREEEGLGWGAVRGVWSSGAGVAMAPLQDVLGLGMDARINTPGMLGGNNWRWRVREEALNSEVADRLLWYTKLYRRTSL